MKPPRTSSRTRLLIPQLLSPPIMIPPCFGYVSICDMNATNSPDLLVDFPLDILGQQERINRLYTQIILCFQIRENAPDLQRRIREIIDRLSQGLARLSVAFPWTAGKIIWENDGFKIEAPEQGRDSPTPIIVNYLIDTPSFPTWDELRQNSFPFGMLDENTIAPCKTMVPVGSGLPVLLVQANFVRGGLLLTINAQHGSMDMRGQGQMVSFLAKACREEMFTREEVEVGNMKRKNLIPLLEDEVTNKDSSTEQESRWDEDGKPAQKSTSSMATTPIIPPIWTYLAFPPTSLSSLKAAATRTLPPDTFVSTDDVLSAFIWQAITRARQPRLQRSPSPAPSTTLTRNVDVRSHFGLPLTYPGLVTTATSHTYPVEELAASRDIGTIASGLRAALDPAALIRSTRVQATAISRDGAAAGRRSIAATSDPGLDVRLSSWAKEGFYHMDFGSLLGRPEAVRRPGFVDGAREGLVYFLPKDRDGEIVVGVCLRHDDLERLRWDEHVGKLSRWIG